MAEKQEKKMTDQPLEKRVLLYPGTLTELNEHFGRHEILWQEGEQQFLRALSEKGLQFQARLQGADALIHYRIVPELQPHLREIGQGHIEYMGVPVKKIPTEIGPSNE
ncbi:MAG: hypothetical protein Q7R96_04750 [Nanoarchaeota archaeon]|nr:hypothetical protein [Nanoarchaeota archaeon]